MAQYKASTFADIIKKNQGLLKLTNKDGVSLLEWVEKNSHSNIKEMGQLISEYKLEILSIIVSLTAFLYQTSVLGTGAEE